MTRFIVEGEKVRIIELGANAFNEMCIGRDGPMVYNKHDQYVGRSLKLYGEYCWEEGDLFRRMVKPEHLVVEAGANIGSHTVALSRLAKAVHAFEPQRLAFLLLDANLALGQCTNAFTHRVALGAEATIASIPDLDPTKPANIGGVSLTNNSTDIQVAVAPLDGLWFPHLDFLKIDVEGMEIDVLRGAAKLIGKYRPVIYCENDRREKSEALVDWLRDAGYTLFWHRPHLYNPHNFFGNAENVFPNIVSINMLCLPNAVDLPPLPLMPVGHHDEIWGGSAGRKVLS